MRGKQAKAATAPNQERSARSRRTRQASAQSGLRSASFVFRHRSGNAVIFLLLVVAAAQLFTLQVPRAEGLRAEAAGQLKVTDIAPALRGSIVDRNGDKLAFTIEARALTFQPVKVRKQLRKPSRRTAQNHLRKRPIPTHGSGRSPPRCPRDSTTRLTRPRS